MSEEKKRRDERRPEDEEKRGGTDRRRFLKQAAAAGAAAYAAPKVASAQAGPEAYPPEVFIEFCADCQPVPEYCVYLVSVILSGDDDNDGVCDGDPNIRRNGSICVLCEPNQTECEDNVRFRVVGTDCVFIGSLFVETPGGGVLDECRECHESFPKYFRV